MHPSLADLPGTPPIESAEFWRQPERVEASSDPDTATAQTIRIMCNHVKRAASDPLLQQTAAQAVSQFGGLAGDTQDGALQVACAAWWYHKLYIKFLLHDLFIWNKLGESGHLQGLISPEILIRMKDPEGDCAIFSMGIAAMLRCFGIPYEFVTVKVNRREPAEYGHVYLYAVMGDGRRIPLDASHGDYPGWQVPSRDILYAQNQTGTPALQAWDVDGNPVIDQGSRFEGLHMYGLRGGFGATICDDTGYCYDDGTGDGTTYGATSGGQCPGSPGCPGYVDPNVATMTPSTFTSLCADGSAPIATGGCSSSGGYATGYTAPSQSSSAAWAAFATAMGKAGMTLAQINAIQPGTVVGANGQILRQSTGYAVPGTTLTSTLTSAFGSNSTLIIGLAAVAGLLLFMGKR